MCLSISVVMMQRLQIALTRYWIANSLIVIRNLHFLMVIQFRVLLVVKYLYMVLVVAGL